MARCTHRIKLITNKIRNMTEENKSTEKQCDIHVVGSRMFVLVENTTKDDYGLFTDKIVAIQKQGQIIILEPKDLRQLEKTLGCNFRI
jgi:hypothetical protein